MHLKSLQERIQNVQFSRLEATQRECFISIMTSSQLPNNSSALSVSVGDGIWDYLIFRNNKRITKIIATDIVDNPVAKEDVALLRAYGYWDFIKVAPEKKLPFLDESFDCVVHQDVFEHVSKPFLFISEQYRVLKKDGILIFGTPNLFRPANILKILVGALHFPVRIGSNIELGEYIHIQEFYGQQVKILLKEVGFSKIEVKYCFFGIHPLNIRFCKYPKSKIGETMCHYFMFQCVK